jgi:hypothetical protein
MDDVRIRFPWMHYVNFIAVVIQFITGTNQKGDKLVQGQFSEIDSGSRPGLHYHILWRSTMSDSDFHEHLDRKYNWWNKHSRDKGDTRFLDLFLGLVMQEILALRDEWANPAIDLEVTLARIIAFFMKHMACDYPRQTFLILMHILSSKCFRVSRKTIARKWRRRKWQKSCQFVLLSDVRIIRKLRIHAFFFSELYNFFISIPSLQQQILNFEENDARLFWSVIEGFKNLTTLFLTNDVPFPIQLQTQICISSCNFVYRFENDPQLWYQMMRRKFHLVQNMDKKFRVHLIGRSHLLFILIWRIFNQSHQNRLRKIPLFMSVKLMLSRCYFYRFFPEIPIVQRFLSLPMHPK